MEIQQMFQGIKSCDCLLNDDDNDDEEEKRTILVQQAEPPSMISQTHRNQ
jgi:hypothetical protein